MARRRGGRGGGGGGQQNPPAFQLWLERTIDTLIITVRLFAGENPKTGYWVGFFVGTERRPFAGRLMDPVDPTKGYKVQINNAGFGEARVDLASLDLEKHTHVTAIDLDNNRLSKPEPIPVEVTAQGKIGAKKRIKVLPEEEEIVTYDSRIPLDIQTFGDDGKLKKNDKVILRFSEPATVINTINGLTLADNVTVHEAKSDKYGFLQRTILVSGLKGMITIVHLGTGETLTRKFVFR
jgi:hypothetical protein